MAALRRKKPSPSKKPQKKSPSKGATKASAKKPSRSAAKTKTKTKPSAGSSRTATSKRRAAPRSSKRPALKPKRAAPKKKARVVIESAPPNPEALKLARFAASVVLDKKALDVTIIDVRAKGAAVGYDYLVLATGESDRQLDAMGAALRDAAKTAERRPSSTEASPDWVLVNFDDVVVHLFTPEKRALYDLDGLWSDAPRVGVTG